MQYYTYIRIKQLYAILIGFTTLIVRKYRGSIVKQGYSDTRIHYEFVHILIIINQLSKSIHASTDAAKLQGLSQYIGTTTYLCISKIAISIFLHRTTVQALDDTYILSILCIISINRINHYGF